MVFVRPGAGQRSQRMRLRPLEAQGQARLAETWSWLRLEAAEPQFEQLLHAVFHSGAADAAALRDRLLRGMESPPALVVVEAGDLSGALAGYSPKGDRGQPTIYVSADLVAPSADAALLERVLLEEIGHHFDHLLNGANDTPGDEGELFAAWVLGEPLDPARLAAIAADNDAGELRPPSRECLPCCAMPIPPRRHHPQPTPMERSPGAADRRTQPWNPVRS